MWWTEDVVWCCVALCDVVLCGVVLCGVVLCCVVLCGVVLCRGAVRCGMCHLSCTLLHSAHACVCFGFLAFDSRTFSGFWLVLTLLL